MADAISAKNRIIDDLVAERDSLAAERLRLRGFIRAKLIHPTCSRLAPSTECQLGADSGSRQRCQSARAVLAMRSSTAISTKKRGS